MTEKRQAGNRAEITKYAPLYYLGFGVVWVVLGARLAFFQAAAAEPAGSREIVKDLIFVVLGALFLRYLIQRESHQRSLANAALRDTRELSDRIFAASPCATCITRLDDGIFIDLNPAFSRLLGYSRAELIGRSPAHLGIALGARSRADMLQSVGQGVSDEPVEFRTKMGEPRHGLASMTIIDYNGRACLLSALVDDTERRKAEEALRQNEEHYRTLFESNPLPMWVYDRLTLGFLGVNEAAVRAYGYSREEFLAMSIEDIRPLQSVPPLRAFIEELEEGNQTHASKLWQHTRRDGSIIDVQIISNNIVFRDRQARLVLAHDVTERVLAETALRESEERFRAIFEQAAVGLVQTTLDGRYLRVNQRFCDLLGYSREELMGQSYQSVTHPDDVDICRPAVLDLEDPGCASVDYEKRFCTREGASLWANVTLAVVRDSHGKPKHLVAVIEDITRRKQDADAIRTLNDQLQLRVNRLLALRHIDLTISASVNLDLILRVVLEQVTSQLEVDAAAVLLYHRDAGSIEYVSARGLDTAAVKTARPRLGEIHAGRAIIERRRIHIPDLLAEGAPAAAIGAQWSARAEQDDDTAFPLDVAAGFRGYAALPLIAKGQVRGVLEVFRREPLEPTDDWWEFCDTLAGELAIAIDNVSLFAGLQSSNQELTRAYDTTLEGWSRALDLRDRETEGHTQRVTDLAVALAEEMGLGPAQVLHMRRGALLHDIGKMGIPDDILLKPGPLTPEEWVVMRRHPGIARDLLAPIAFLRPALDIPHCHHEKWSGDGYPRGLAGTQIPLAARIFSVVDVWDALTSDRVYRAAWTHERALAYIREQSGLHFDPQVVVAFEKLLQSIQQPQPALK